MCNKGTDQCIILYNEISSKLEQLFIDFDEFSDVCSTRSEICKYWDNIVRLTSLLHNLIAADRECDWHAHLQAVQELMSVFRECDNINYLRYASWYLEKMRKLPVEHPDIYEQFTSII